MQKVPTKKLYKYKRFVPDQSLLSSFPSCWFGCVVEVEKEEVPAVASSQLLQPLYHLGPY